MIPGKKTVDKLKLIMYNRKVIEKCNDDIMFGQRAFTESRRQVRDGNAVSFSLVSEQVFTKSLALVGFSMKARLTPLSVGGLIEPLSDFFK